SRTKSTTTISVKRNLMRLMKRRIGTTRSSTMMKVIKTTMISATTTRNGSTSEQRVPTSDISLSCFARAVKVEHGLRRPILSRQDAPHHQRGGGVLRLQIHRRAPQGQKGGAYFFRGQARGCGNADVVHPGVE